MASTSSVGCSFHVTPCHSMEQATSMVMDSQSVNALAADSGSEKVKKCFLGLKSMACSQWPVVNGSDADSDCLPGDSDAKHVQHTNCITSKSKFK